MIPVSGPFPPIYIYSTHCITRAAQNIQGHHWPVIAPLHQAYRLQSHKNTCIQHITRYRSKPDKSPHVLQTAMHHSKYYPVRSQSSLSPAHRLWWVVPRWVKLSRIIHSLWCPSANFFKFVRCRITIPRAHKLLISLCASAEAEAQVGIIYGRNYNGI